VTHAMLSLQTPADKINKVFLLGSNVVLGTHQQQLCTCRIAFASSLCPLTCGWPVCVHCRL
jgi:hypothetical protein